MRTRNQYTKKKQYMTIGNDYVYGIADIGVIQKTTEYNYLGVHLNETGKDNEDILKTVGKGRKRHYIHFYRAFQYRKEQKLGYLNELKLWKVVRLMD